MQKPERHTPAVELECNKLRLPLLLLLLAAVAGAGMALAPGCWLLAAVAAGCRRRHHAVTSPNRRTIVRFFLKGQG